MSEFTDKITRAFVRVTEIIKSVRDDMHTRLADMETATDTKIAAAKTEAETALAAVNDTLSGSLNTLKTETDTAVQGLDKRLKNVEENGGGGSGGSNLDGLDTQGLITYLSFDKANHAYVMPDYGPFIGCNNGGTVVQGNSGTALRLSGTQSVVLNENYNFIHQTGIFTVAARLRLSSLPQGTIVQFFANTDARNDGYGVWCTLDNKFQSSAFRLHITRGVYGSNEEAVNITVSNSVLSDNLWHDYVITGDGSTFKMYIDSKLVGSGGLKKPFGSGNALLSARAGYTTSDRPTTEFYIDGLWIYARTLDAEEVMALHQYRNS